MDFAVIYLFFNRRRVCTSFFFFSMQRFTEHCQWLNFCLFGRHVNPVTPPCVHPIGVYKAFSPDGFGTRGYGARIERAIFAARFYEGIGQSIKTYSCSNCLKIALATHMSTESHYFGSFTVPLFYNGAFVESPRIDRGPFKPRSLKIFFERKYNGRWKKQIVTPFFRDLLIYV